MGMVSAMSDNGPSSSAPDGQSRGAEASPGPRLASQGVDVTVPARIVSSSTVYRGAIFSVEDRRIALTGADGHETMIRRQVVRHCPSVVMLVHDEATDRYILEREYRAGSDTFAYGLPAGLMDAGESVEHCALRELREETGVVPDSADDMRFESAGDCYSSEGMTDELVHILVLHLRAWHEVGRDFDPDEYVDSSWVDWPTLCASPIRESNAVIALQHEMIRRLRHT